MKHFDVFQVLNDNNGEELGYVTICAEEGVREPLFTYCFRFPNGEYSLLTHLNGMDLKDVVKMQDGKLQKMILEKLPTSDVRLGFIRQTDSKWSKAIQLAPDILVNAWLPNMMHYFKED